ncbi:MAG TPA: DUF4856 domain-containing protein [Bacteroidia bacterium]|nr:DUF4856 domain-containing protein [Bacteroidia bacterium]
MNKFQSALFAFTMSAVAFSSCKKESIEPPPPPPGGYTVPTTYNFANVNYSGQSYRLDMMTALTTYMKTGNTPNTVVSAATMKNMYSNSGSPFSDSVLDNCGKQIKNKIYPADQLLFEAFMDSLALASTSTVTGSNGVAGVVVSSADPSKKYLCDANGVEWTQVIEKGIMGACFYYQTTAFYLDASQIGTGVDNTTVIPGEGTAMEHHWDEAFGYFGVPVDFPANVATVRYWGKYCNERNTLMGTNATMMNAFLAGRAAISNNDHSVKDAQVTVIRETWDKYLAATIISYLNKAVTNISDDAQRNHSLSEAIGFLIAIKYNPACLLDSTQIAAVQAYIGTNLYNVTIANLNLAKDLISSVYNLDNIKNSL